MPGALPGLTEQQSGRGGRLSAPGAQVRLRLQWVTEERRGR
jgi:hypothetical protein